jgi:hypothetical protein
MRRLPIRGALTVGAILALTQAAFAPSPGWQFGDLCVAAAFALIGWAGYRAGKL